MPRVMVEPPGTTRNRSAQPLPRPICYQDLSFLPEPTLPFWDLFRGSASPFPATVVKMGGRRGESRKKKANSLRLLCESVREYVCVCVYVCT